MKKGKLFSFKTLGRIIMIAVAALMFYYGIKYWVDFSKFVKEFEGFSFKNLFDTFNGVAGLLKSITFLLFGVSALLSALFGKGKIKYFIFSVVILVICVLNISAAVKEGTFDIATYIGPTVIVPVLYVLGSLFLFL